MSLHRIDLNLLVVFEKIYAERNLTRVAESLNITQPAVSNALARLRLALDDPLFVRTPRGMVPTPVARNMIATVRQALRDLESCVRQRQSFEARTTRRAFRIGINEPAQLMLLAPLMARLTAEAPGITLQTFYPDRRAVIRDLTSGDLDVAIDAPLINDPQLNARQFLAETMVCAVRRDHPLMASGGLTLETYLGLDHIHVSSRRQGLGYVDLGLRAINRQRRIVLRTQHYVGAFELLALSDLALTVPRAVATGRDVAALPLPFDVEPLRLNLFWHKHSEQDAANRWLRSRVLLAGRDLAHRATRAETLPNADD